MALTRVQTLMLNELLIIQTYGPKDREFGLCKLMTDKLPFAYMEMMGELRTLFKSWDKFSGDETFPVPDPKIKADMAYLMNDGDMWDKRTTYGKNRWLLLDHCIVQLSKT